MTMAHRDSDSIRAQGISLVVVSVVVLAVVGWLLLSFLGGAVADIRCDIPDDQMETCDDDDPRTP